MTRLLIQSKPFIASEVQSLCSAIDSKVKRHSDIKLAQTYLVSEDEIDSETYFSGATAAPLLLDNFSPNYRGDLVKIRKYSKLLSATELAIDTRTTIESIVKWSEAGFSSACRIAFEDLSLPQTALFIKSFSDSTRWKVGWRLYNKVCDLSASVGERVRRGNIILASLGSPFGDQSGHFIADGEFLEFIPVDNTRLLSDGRHGFGFGDMRAEKSIYLDFSVNELPLVTNGFQRLISELEISGRLCVDLSCNLESYSSWVQTFDHDIGYYEYLYEGTVRQSATSFFRGETSQAPTGLVPFGTFKLGEGVGFATLSFEFVKNGTTRFYLSGNKDALLDHMNEFLDVTGLSEFVDELSLVSE